MSTTPLEDKKWDAVPTLEGEEDLRARVDQLKAFVEELQHKKLEAEKDRELFRDLYSKASAHVSEVSKENTELLERAERAENRLADGLAMVKGTYEARIKTLQNEMEKWRGLCAVLTNKDNRTDDEVRRKAALEPELREQNRLLRGELEELRTDYAEAQEQLGLLTKQELEELEDLRENGYSVSTPQIEVQVAIV